MIDYAKLNKDELIELLEVMKKNKAQFEKERERIIGTMENLRAEIRIKELDVMINLAKDCIDYLNERIKEKE
jgi:rRNA processing protein Krr1/Pno1